MGKTFSFVSGALFGAAAGAIIGVALAPRSGAETRAMAADIANDAWDNMRDTYEHGAEEARAAVNDFGPMVDAKTDDLRAKVDLARERMDQLREQLNRECAKRKIRVHYPELHLCTDNGAMIAMAAAMRMQAGQQQADKTYSFDVKPRWPLDAIVEAA